MATANPDGERGQIGTGTVSVGNLTLNFDRFQTSVRDERVDLTYDEFEVLALLCSQADRVISYDILARHLWDMTGRVANRRLNVMVHRIRVKLGDISPYEIRTVRERGYGLVRMDGARRDH
jgi:DNA-binding response OmpR family regulator